MTWFDTARFERTDESAGRRKAAARARTLPRSWRRHRKPSIVTISALALLGFVVMWLAPDFASSSVKRPPRDLGAHPVDQLSADFALCAGGRINCVVDGDTFWLAGVKYRIADIDTPETHSPRCAVEAALGARATNRLISLLNAGPFALESGPRTNDHYGRALRVVTRNGVSIGDRLAAEGLARRWSGHRNPWC